MRKLYEAKLLRVVNETTIDLYADLGLGVSTRVRLHLHGVQASPETDRQVVVGYIEDWFKGHRKVNFGTIMNDEEPSVYSGYVFADSLMTACLNDALIDAGYLDPQSE